MPAKGGQATVTAIAGALGRLHVITGDLAIASAALDAGAPVIQVRAKSLSDAELYELVCRVVEHAARREAAVIVNDRVDIAVAAGAAGAHVGAHDLPVAAARAALGPARHLGGTARDPDAARAHEAAGATYLGVGPTYATASKEGLPDPLGVTRVGAIAVAVSIPVIAIAGVTAERVPELLDAGVYGVAVIGAVANAPDPGLATEALLRALEKAG
jgi:thiamine-phosphate pyrophosphorylase